MICMKPKNLLLVASGSLLLLSFRNFNPIPPVKTGNPIVKAAAEVFVVDKNQSKLTWKGEHVFKFNSHNGSIKIDEGSLTFENGLLTKGTFGIDMNTIEDIDKVDDLINHLKSEDFFNVKKFPRSKFVITKVTPIKDAKPGENNYEIEGDLTMKDITNSIAFRAKVAATKDNVKAYGRTIIDRTKWDIKYSSGKFFASLGDETISDAIQVEMNIIAKK